VSESSGDGVRLRAYRVHGRVQGVGFRWWTRAVAVQLGLGGHVRNLSTGSVEVHAAGRLDLLEQFESQLAEGPQSARVTSVEDIQPDREMSHDSFDIVLQ
jgi:acylphosphatase